MEKAVQNETHSCKLANPWVMKGAMILVISLFIASILVPFYQDNVTILGYLIAGELAVVGLSNGAFYSVAILLPSVLLLAIQFFIGMEKSTKFYLVLIALVNAIIFYFLTGFEFAALNVGAYLYLGAYAVLLFATVVSFLVKIEE